jgi:transposase
MTSAWQPEGWRVLRSLMWVIEELVPDGLWERIAPLLPPPKPRRDRYPGRRPIDDRAALAGIVFVLKTGINWNQLPTSLLGCSGVTCWRRLRDWTAAGVWPALHEQLLAELRAAGELDLDRCAVDGSHVRALKGGTTSARHRLTAAVRAPSTI